MSTQTLFRALALLGAVSTSAWAQDVPLVASYPMEPDADAQKLLDSGPLKIEGSVRSGAKIVPNGVRGNALYLSGEGEQSQARVTKGGVLNRLGSPLTISLWVKPEKFPKNDAPILTKRSAAWQSAPFELDISPSGNLGVNLNNGAQWAGVWFDRVFKVGTWTHVAVSHAPDGELVVYVDGKERRRQKFGGSLASNDNPLAFGWMQNMDFPGGARSPFQGWIDEVRLYAAVLTPEQIIADKDGLLTATRPAKDSDFAAPTHYVALRLARYDAPLSSTHGRGFVNAKAERIGGPDAVDWPQFSLSGQPIWDKDAEESRFLPLRDGDAARSLFQRPDDEVISPGNHWLRPLKGFLHRDVITSDRTARTDENQYQLWTFPIEIRGAGESDVRDVVLKYSDAEIYRNAGPLRSLTLLLPQNEGGKPYELSVAGRAPVRFDVGLKPVVPGNPRNELLPLNVTLAGAPKITVSNAKPAFGAQKEWDADLKRLALAMAATQTTDVLSSRRAEAAKNHNGGADTPPMLAYYPMEPDSANPQRVADIGPLGFDGNPQEAAFAGGSKRDNALQLGGGKARASFKIKPLDGPIKTLTVAFWVRLDESPRGGNPAILVTKRPAPYSTTPFALEVAPDGTLGFNGNNGAWQNFASRKKLTPGEWHHIALTLQSGDAARLYFDGEAAGSKKLSEAPFVANTAPVVFGYEENAAFPGGARSGFVGAFDEARIYLAALSPEQIKAEMAGTLAARAPQGIAAPAKAATPVAAQASAPRPLSWRERIGIDVPRSPLSIYSVSLPHGMSGGHFLKSAHGPAIQWFDKGKRFPGSASDYANYLADTGYDRVFEQAGDNAFSEGVGEAKFDQLARALKARGIGLGLTPDVDWKRPFLTHPNVAFLSHNLPDWHAPLYRSLQLATQRLHRNGNFAGVSIGADGGSGYVPFWDWAPPNPGTPWSEAHLVQFGEKRPVAAKATGGSAPTREYLDYIAAHDKTAGQYGYFARAVREVAPGAAVTTGSYGPGGVGARGGAPWATNPGKEIFAALPVLQAYDWDETLAHKPLYNVASLDRLQSYHPDKPAWALMDDFYLKFGRESRQRAYALALTRGVSAIGPNWLAQPSGEQANPEKAAAQKELYSYLRRMGGAYAGTRPNATIGILYVHPQSLLRRFNQTGDNKISDAELLAASHDGKTREALFMAHAAGWPARLITPEEWKRGLPAEMKAVLLTGLTPTDGTWNWWDGLESQLKTFAQNGGRLLLDNESVVPAGVEGTQTGLQIRGYITQGDGASHGQSPDKTPLLFARNAANLPLLKTAMQGIAAPLAVSGDSTIWAIPHTTGDVQYLTVVNNAVEAGQTTEKAFNPKVATLNWNTSRPLYDLRSGKKLALDAAQTVDLTKDAFATFALPPSEISAPRVAISRDEQGFYQAKAHIGDGNLRGVPMEFSIEKDGQKATVFASSGAATRLPIFEKGAYSITATELLSGLSGKLEWKQDADFAPPSEAAASLATFAARKDAPLVVALTPEQQKDLKIVALAKRIADFYAKNGRKVETRTLAPREVVTGLQPNRLMQKYPQWQTIEADLVLLGSAATNPLIFDQERGGLLADKAAQVTFSPFVGEFHALNLIGSDAASLAAAFDAVAR